MFVRKRLAGSVLLAATMLTFGAGGAQAEAGRCLVTDVWCVLGVPSGGRCGSGIQRNCWYCSFNDSPSPSPDEFCDRGFPGWSYRGCGLWLGFTCAS